MDVQQRATEDRLVGVTGPSTSIDPPPYTQDDVKQYSQKLQEAEAATETKIGFKEEVLKNGETGETTIEDLEKGQQKLEELNDYALMFSEETIQRAFCRKVFSLLAILLLQTVVYCALCTYCRPIREFWHYNLLHIFWGMPIYFATVLIIICCPTIRKTPPWNYILLFLFSSSTTFMIGGICAIYDEEVVMIAFAMTTVLVLGLTWFAFQTKWDFTASGMIILSFALIASLTTVLSLSYMAIGWRIALSGLVLFFFSLLLIVDIQYIISGDHKYKISPEEHIFAVTVLYLDIMRLFLVILDIIR